MFDVSGVSLLEMHRHLTHPAVKQESALTLDFFPEMLSKVLVVNAPFGTQVGTRSSSRPRCLDRGRDLIVERYSGRSRITAARRHRDPSLS